MGSMKDFVQTCGYSIDTKPRPEASCDTCGYLWQKRMIGRVRNYCGLYYKLRKDEVIIPNPTHSLCRCHIEKCR